MSDKLTSENEGMSRRDFSKLMGVGLATVVGYKYESAIGGAQRETNENGVESVVTTDGEFFRLPDFHVLDYSVRELEKLPKIDGIGFEFITNQVNLMDASPPEVIEKVTQLSSSARSKRELVPMMELDFFADRGAYIIFEGQVPQENVYLKSMGVQLMELFGGMGYTFKRLLDIKNKA